MQEKYAKICIAMAVVVLMVDATSAQVVNLENSTSFADHNFVFVEQRFNNTPNKILELATPDEPFFVTTKNETLVISLAEWGDDSRYGVIVKISNGSYSALMPLERGWGTQVDEKVVGDLKIQIGLMEVFRGRNIEFVRIGIFITRNR